MRRPRSTTVRASVPRLLRIGLLVGIIGAGCGPGGRGHMDAEREAAIADTLLSLTRQVDTAFTQLEPGPYLRYYSEDAHFYYRGTHLPKKKFETVVRKEMAAFERYSTEILAPRVEVLGPNGGVVSFRYRGQVADTTGNARSVSAAVTLVFERRNGEWKVVQAHESFVPSQGDVRAMDSRPSPLADR